jgi:hypothetical protein
MDTNQQLNVLSLANEQLLHKFHQKLNALSNLIQENNAHEVVPLLMQFIDEEYPSFEQIAQRAGDIESFLGNHKPTGSRLREDMERSHA